MPEAADGDVLELRGRLLGADPRQRHRPPARGRRGRTTSGTSATWCFVKAIEKDGGFDHWSYRQIPAIQGGFMAMDTQTGRVLAMQGGFSYQSSVFNRATQALRQPGSSFKPFVYAAALDSGYSPATIVLDAPIEVATGAGIWKPENSGNTYYGPTPMRTGIEQSRNLMTVRIAQDIGMDMVARYGERFGIYDKMPPLLSYSLGAGETTLYKMVAAYAELANGGLKVEPTLVDRVQDRYGKTIYRHDQRPARAAPPTTSPTPRSRVVHSNAERVMDAITAYQVTSMLQGAVARGTSAASVGQLHLNLAGKTGTTNEAKDVWYIGYSPRIVAGCYMGYDTPRPLGKRLRRHALRADLRRVHQEGDGRAGSGQLAGAAGWPLHHDRPPHRPAAGGRRRAATTCRRNTSATARS